VLDEGRFYLLPDYHHGSRFVRSICFAGIERIYKRLKEPFCDEDEVEHWEEVFQESAHMPPWCPRIEGLRIVNISEAQIWNLKMSSRFWSTPEDKSRIFSYIWKPIKLAFQQIKRSFISNFLQGFMAKTLDATRAENSSDSMRSLE